MRIAYQGEPGAFSEPIEMPWGYCIVKREKFSEADIIALLKEEVGSSVMDKILQEYQATSAKATIRYTGNVSQE